MFNTLEWANKAQIGERVIYAQQRGQSHPRPSILALAYQAHEAGLVFLAQRKVTGGYDYEATRIHPRLAAKLRLLPHQREWKR